MERMTTFLVVDTDFKATSCVLDMEPYAPWGKGRRRGIFPTAEAV